MAVSYQNWRGRHVEVPDETLAAVLAALGENGVPAGRAGPLDAAVAPFPARRSLGLRRAAVLGALARLLGPR